MALRKEKKHRIAAYPVDVTIDDVYNQQIPTETPDLIASKLEELDRELHLIPNKKKKEWIMAMDECPDLCDDEKFKLIFLRSEVFNCVLSAKRVVKYWAKRVQLFGISEAFKPLVLGEDGPMKGDEEALKYGMFRTTNRNDSSGRPILFCDPSRLPVDHSCYQNESVIRATWYMAHAFLENDITQRKGAVIIIFPKNVKLAQFNPKLAKMFAESFQGCIPIRLSALHFCHLPLIFDLIFPLLKVLMGPHLRKKVHVFSGAKNKVLETFADKFGIPKENLPIEVGGLLEIDHDRWLKNRLQKDVKLFELCTK